MRRIPGHGARRAAAICAFFAICAAAGAAGAAGNPAGSTEVLGRVLSLDGEELIVDLGTDAGASDGQVLELWRPVELKHPITGKKIIDRFRIGEVKVSQARKQMSLAAAQGSPIRTPQSGDIVIFTRAAPVAPETTKPIGRPGTKAETTPDKPGPNASEPAQPAVVPPLDPEAQAVSEMFEALSGADVATRITTYERYATAHPESRFALVLQEEAAALRRTYETRRGPFDERKPESKPIPGAIAAPVAVRAVAGKPLEVAVEVNRVTIGALLHVRTKGQPFFESFPMSRVGAAHFSATVPSNRVGNGAMEYYIEGTDGSVTASIVGSSIAPEPIPVEPQPRVAKAPGGLASVSVWTDYADYNRFRGNDYTWQTEGTFGIRYKDTGFRALRMGFGVYRGVGGSVFELDEENKMGRSVGLTYGYVETELAPHRVFSFILRGAVGLLDDGVSGGTQLLVRIGNDQGTNLVAGGEFLGGVGLRGILELNLNVFERWPILLRSEVTTQPAGSTPSSAQAGDDNIAQGGGDLAGRGIVQLGYRFFPGFIGGVRASAQGRNINHAGLGGGAFVGYSW